MTDFPAQPLSPLDGRYRSAVAPLTEYLSEAGLNRARVEVEVEWLITLTNHALFGTTPLTEEQKLRLRALYLDFGQEEIGRASCRERVSTIV